MNWLSNFLDTLQPSRIERRERRIKALERSRRFQEQDQIEQGVRMGVFSTMESPRADKQQREANLAAALTEAEDRLAKITMQNARRSDIKNILLAVSLATSGFLGGIVYSRGTDVEKLSDEVKVLRAENQNFKRESSGKIRIKPDEIVVPEGQISGTLQYIAALQKKTRLLEEMNDSLHTKIQGVQRNVEQKTTKALRTESSVQERPSLNTKGVSMDFATTLISQIAKDIPQGVRVYPTYAKGTLQIIYTDATGYSRFFSVNRPENADKRTQEGLLTWMNTKYLESMDREARNDQK